MLYQELAPIISNHEVMPGVHLIWVDSPDIASSARPGQFVMITCDNGRERLLRRPISIHQVERKQVAFLFAVMGNGTEWLAERQQEKSWIYWDRWVMDSRLILTLTTFYW